MGLFEARPALQGRGRLRRKGPKEIAPRPYDHQWPLIPNILIRHAPRLRADNGETAHLLQRGTFNQRPKGRLRAAYPSVNRADVQILFVYNIT